MNPQHSNPHFQEKNPFHKQQILPILIKNIINSCHLPVVFAGHSCIPNTQPGVIFRRNQPVQLLIGYFLLSKLLTGYCALLNHLDAEDLKLLWEDEAR